MDKMNIKKLFTVSHDEDGYKFFQDIFKVLLIWCPIVSLLFTVGFGRIANFSDRFIILMIIASITAICCMFGSKLIFVIEKYIFKKLNKPLLKHGYFWGFFNSYLFLLPGLHLGFRAAEIYSHMIERKWSAPGIGGYSSGVIFGIMASGLFLLFEVIREFREEKRVTELKFQKIETERLKAQVSALSAQMNPHLLFNSLNTIASTISTNPDSAEEMTVLLAELYRGVLKSSKGEMHTLEDELSLCESYLTIEKNRFGERVNFEMDVDKSIITNEITIPVLLLQPIVENSIKHGLSPKKEGGKLILKVRKDKDWLYIDISDNGVGQNSLKSDGTGIGISNCESRIKIQYGEMAKFKFNCIELGASTNIQLPLAEV